MKCSQKSLKFTISIKRAKTICKIHSENELHGICAKCEYFLCKRARQGKLEVKVKEKCNNCAPAHCSCKNTAESFDHYVTRTLCKNYSRQELFSRSFIVTAVEFDAGYVDMIARRSVSFFVVFFFSPLNRSCTKTSLINKITDHESEDIFCRCSMESGSL